MRRLLALAPNGQETECRVDVLNSELYDVCVFTEVTDNAGPSITTNSVRLVNCAIAMLDLEPSRTVFLEHYPWPGDRSLRRVQPAFNQEGQCTTVSCSPLDGHLRQLVEQRLV